MDIAAIANSVMAAWRGDVSLLRHSVTPGAEPWEPGTVTYTETPINARVRGVTKADGADSLAQSADLICDATGETFAPEDKIKSEGREYQIIKIQPVHFQGTVLTRLYLKA